MGAAKRSACSSAVGARISARPSVTGRISPKSKLPASAANGSDEEASMAHKKAGGSSRNGRDSHAQRLGVKRFAGEAVLAGNILIRQRGTQFHPGTNVSIGKDDTLLATSNGKVVFESKGPRNRKVVSVISG